jgi:LEA14-like dessication related protein
VTPPGANGTITRIRLGGEDEERGRGGDGEACDHFFSWRTDMMRAFLHGLAVGVALILGACAGWTGGDAPRVTVAGIEALDGEGLELRMLVKLRVVNPNDFPIDYDGIAVRLEVDGRTIASGAAGEKGTVPRFGEAVVGLPVNVSLVDVARHAFHLFGRDTPGPLHYRLEGKLGSPGFGATRFVTEGDLNLPVEAAAPLAGSGKKPL